MQLHEKKKLLQTLGLCVFSFEIFAVTWNLGGETSNAKSEAIDLHHRDDGAEAGLSDHSPEVHTSIRDAQYKTTTWRGYLEASSKKSRRVNSITNQPHPHQHQASVHPTNQTTHLSRNVESFDSPNVAQLLRGTRPFQGKNSSNHMLNRPGKVKLNHNTSSIPHEFNRAMSRDEYQAIEDLLSVFHSAMTKNNLTYFIASGTLLGSYRHHGIIPWDDDVDVYILSDQKMRVMQALSSLGPQHALDAKTKRWKLFSVFSQPIQGHSWKFPFVDISLLDDHSDWLADSDPAFVPRFSFHKDWIFPLRLRPFGRLMVWAPKNTEMVLKKSYDISICASLNYNHREEIFTAGSIMISCDVLKRIYTFCKKR
ncbi:hypothetical protein CAPTEDRAFT_213888 [Capitella teleta]|uniref:LicD/FKTN/FKRP nucleotidyltransferase domain-containing protein n=1 Tax=Capitella teleta TaxID=283909 RepID=R7T6X9_CAPTE|nr:hypothetical protein CAPTEDRAFT_213888 [Capitella teleta]|eukprot:ELT89290.1 hypothetical protein CAPTEDRAFT_213888 [Capitella teleta]